MIIIYYCHDLTYVDWLSIFYHYVITQQHINYYDDVVPTLHFVYTYSDKLALSVVVKSNEWQLQVPSQKLPEFSYVMS